MIKITLLGEMFNDKDGDYYLEETAKPLPTKMKDKHHIALLNFYKLVVFLLSQKREVPVMMHELKQVGITKTLLREIIGLGYLKSVSAPLLRKTDQHPIGNRTFVYWTPQGRAYVKEYIRHEQGTSNTGSANDSGGVQPEVPAVESGDGLHGELPVELPASTETAGNSDN